MWQPWRQLRRFLQLPSLPAAFLTLLVLSPCSVHGRPGNFDNCSYGEVLAPWLMLPAGWPGGCVVARPARSTTACNESCFEDVHCSGWHFGAEHGCRWASAQCKAHENLEVNQSQSALAFTLVLHGVLRAENLSAGVEVPGLLSLGSLGGKDEDEEIQKCRLVCHADVSCGYWQYGGGACRVERTPLIVKVGNITVGTPLGKLMVAGEQIYRGCPHAPHPYWIIMGCIDFVLGTLAFLWAVTAGTGPTREDPLKRHTVIRNLLRALGLGGDRRINATEESDRSDSESGL